MLENGLDGAIAVEREALGEVLRVKGVPDAEIERVALDIVLRGRSQHGGGNRQDHDALAKLG